MFYQFDPEGFGEIPLEDFLAALRSPEWKTEIPANKRDILLLRAKESRVQAVTFQDFVNVVSTVCIIEKQSFNRMRLFFMSLFISKIKNDNIIHFDIINVCMYK